MPIVSFDPAELPRCPPEIADEVELYARESGRTASLVFTPILFHNGGIMRGVWVANFTLRVNDARMQLWRDGKADEPPSEQVWLWEANPAAGELIEGTHGLREPPKIGLDIAQLGAAGVREFLEKGNSWSGRGEFDSPEDALLAARVHNAEYKTSLKEKAREENRYATRDERRSLLGIPFLGVLKDIGKKKKKVS